MYAIDVGVGQLVGRLPADERLVNLEGRNLGSITHEHVPQRIDIVTIDLSYLPVADAVPQLEVLEFATDADLVALVKPTFELRRGRPPVGPAELEAALPAAADAVDAGWWRVAGTCESAVPAPGAPPSSSSTPDGMRGRDHEAAPEPATDVLVAS